VPKDSGDGITCKHRVDSFFSIANIQALNLLLIATNHLKLYSKLDLSL